MYDLKLTNLAITILDEYKKRGCGYYDCQKLNNGTILRCEIERR